MTLPQWPRWFLDRWDKAAKEAEFNSLSNVQSTAQSWSTSITALTAAFGILTLVKGPDSLTSIDPTWAMRVKIGLFSALFCALIGILLGAFAAQGFPGKRYDEALAYREFILTSASHASKLLGCSRIAVVVAVLLLFGSIAAAWCAPTPTKVSPVNHYLIYLRSGQIDCATLVTGSDGRIVMRRGKPIHSSALPAVARLQPVGACPHL